MAAYCTIADATPFLPAGGLPNPARVAYASASSNALESEGHGLLDGAEVTLRAEVGGSLPAPLVAGTTYYAIAVSPSRFELAATSGGSAIDLTTDGANFVFASELPWAAWLEWGSRQVDSLLPENVTPLVASPFPTIIVTAAAELAAARGVQATSGAAIDLGARIDAVRVRLAPWIKSIPIRGLAQQVHQPANLAITAKGGALDPRGWGGCNDTRIP